MPDEVQVSGWNYRIILHDTDEDPEKHWYGLHEVYYNPTGWTLNPIFVCNFDEGVHTIVSSLENALKDAKGYSVIVESNEDTYAVIDQTDRDLVANPYSLDEQRIVDWLIKRTQGMVGAGNDPIGFVLASYEQIWLERNTMRDALKLTQQTIKEALDV